MSKKKSYMDSKNILSEDVITSFFKGLFRGMSRNLFGKKKKPPKTAQKNLQQSVDKFNSAVDKGYDWMNQLRKDNGLKPKKRPFILKKGEPPRRPSGISKLKRGGMARKK